MERSVRSRMNGQDSNTISKNQSFATRNIFPFLVYICVSDLGGIMFKALVQHCANNVDKLMLKSKGCLFDLV
jgi:hypothetical protein